MTFETVQTLAGMTVIKTLTIAGPILLAGMIVGLLMGVFQSITSIQEMTVSFVPKMLVVGGIIMLLMPWMLNLLTDFTSLLLGNLAQYAQ